VHRCTLSATFPLCPNLEGVTTLGLGCTDGKRERVSQELAETKALVSRAALAGLKSAAMSPQELQCETRMQVSSVGFPRFLTAVLVSPFWGSKSTTLSQSRSPGPESAPPFTASSLRRSYVFVGAPSLFLQPYGWEWRLQSCPAEPFHECTFPLANVDGCTASPHRKGNRPGDLGLCHRVMRQYSA
jgi:hypothetical protein